jgi:hypothetical protein
MVLDESYFKFSWMYGDRRHDLKTECYESDFFHLTTSVTYILSAAVPVNKTVEKVFFCKNIF